MNRITRMTKTTALAAAALALPAGGIAQTPLATIPAHDVAQPKPTSPTPTPTLAGTPASLQCVSAASQSNGELVPHVWRAHATLDGDLATMSIGRGRQLDRQSTPLNV